VNESGANTVRAYAELKARARAMLRELSASHRASPSLREEAGLPADAELVQRLSCAVCGRTAATLEWGIDPSTGERALVYSGLVRREAFLLQGTGDVFEKLAQGKVGALHGSLGAEGIDAYCPACDRVYCGDHYLLQTEYDDGFYDCTRATCPAGHRRMVDD
jgi:hypothetical protein